MEKSAELPDVELANGVKLQTLGFGTWRLKGDTCKTSVTAALETGYRLIDTASCYGNEEFVREGIADFVKASGESKEPEGLFVTSKAFTSEIGFQKTYDAFHNSLKRLGRSSLDLYLIHFPQLSEASLDSPLNRQERRQSWLALEKLLAEGKVRSIGVSNFTSRHLDGLLQDGINVFPMVNQVEMHPLCFSNDLEKYESEKGMVVQAYSPLGAGSAVVMENDVVRQTATKLGVSVPQVLVKWNLQHKFTVLLRSRVKERMVTNKDVFSFEICDSDMKALDALRDLDVRTCWDPRPVL